MPATRPIHIVDDDVGFLRGLERLISAHGWKVRTFSSAEDFQTRANPSDAACLILDIHLGTASGIDIMRDLAKSGIRTPVLLITGSDSEHLRKTAIDAGCGVYLQKPVSATVLMDALRQATGGPPAAR
jgi:FixJ family two-component response regulator